MSNKLTLIMKQLLYLACCLSFFFCSNITSSERIPVWLKKIRYSPAASEETPIDRALDAFDEGLPDDETEGVGYPMPVTPAMPHQYGNDSALRAATNNPFFKTLRQIGFHGTLTCCNVIHKVKEGMREE